MMYNHHDSLALGHFRDGRFNPFMGETASAPTDAFGANSAVNTATDSSHLTNSMERADSGNPASFKDQNLRRQSGEQSGAFMAQARPGDTTQPATGQSAKRKAGRDQPNPRQVEAPNRPAVLPPPRWPGNPY
jgi:hypothetical protein